MSKKVDHVYNEYYQKHINGGKSNFRISPKDARLALRERMYTRVLSEMCMNRFEWINLPPEIDVRFLEQTLFFNALSVFFHDDEYDKYFALRGAGVDWINYQDQPTAFNVIGNNEYVSKTLRSETLDGDPPECVPIWANYMRMPDLDIVMLYSQELADISQTIHINSIQARRSKVIVADEQQRLSATNINNELDKGSGVVFLNNVGGEMLQQWAALDMGVNASSILELQQVRRGLWNECMGLLGLKNANQDKKERLVEAEVSANDEQIENMRAVNLNARQEACERINRLYPGLNVSVKYKVVETDHGNIHDDIETGDHV